MSIKPDDIPQGAWDAAEEHRQLWARGPSTIKEAVARAIMAENAECAALVNPCQYDMGFDRELGPMGCRLDLQDGCVCSGIATAIRRRGAPGNGELP